MTDLLKGCEVTPDIETLDELAMDIQGMMEINRPWNTGNKTLYQMQLDIICQNANAAHVGRP